MPLLRGAVLAALLLLGACRTLPVSPTPANAEWGARRTELQALSHYSFSGRVAVAAAGNGFNASLHWTQDGARAQMALEGPLGIGAVQVVAEGDALSMVNARGEPLAAEAARHELSARLGFELPLASLRYWLLGAPDPAQPAQEELDAGAQRLSSLIQAGWHVTYGAYTAVAGAPLPARVTLERETVRVRVIIDAWQL
ncbi:MAG: outer membrane lipoprotein LolB [Gammaproteobacteria bacterium]|nr:outer membrane lipoprotein LolB [Gammaproteobacteria bacterium]